VEPLRPWSRIWTTLSNYVKRGREGVESEGVKELRKKGREDKENEAGDAKKLEFLERHRRKDNERIMDPIDGEEGLCATIRKRQKAHARHRDTEPSKVTEDKEKIQSL
jgi:hypothetical protein